MNDASASMNQWVAGVDGCRSGWVVVLRDPRAGTHIARVVPDFRAVLMLPESPAVIAVDIPIGLLDSAVPGGRACELLARRVLGKRASSVFSAPSRAALRAFRTGAGYEAVSAANRGGLAISPGISKQSFAILSKIDEVDASITAASQGVVREVHPELCFAEANAGVPMAHPKKKPPGRTERVALLTKLGFMKPLELLGASLPQGTNSDDLLDACIACWTAERVARGSAVVTPASPPADSRGLRMELWC